MVTAVWEGGSDNPLGGAFRAQEDEAKKEAALHLGQRGFELVEVGLFRGSLVVPSAHERADVVVQVDVKLPGGFPSELPEVYVADGQLPPVFAHRERSGKICVSSPGNESV